MKLHTLCLLGVLATVPGWAGSWATNSFRTASGDLIQRGNTMTEVLRRAGQPVERQVISHGIAVGGVIGVNRELWTYRGTDGIYTVTFAGNRVEQIDVVPYR